MRIALLGYSGYWGQKLGKILSENHQIVGVDTTNTGEIDYILEGVQAAVIATPPDTHYRLAMKALKAGLDVLVEKPMAMRSSQAKEMAELARAEGLVLSVDSTFLHTKAFEYLKALDKPMLSYQSIRLAPPMAQAQIGAGWDLIVHDLSIIQGLSSLEYVVNPGIEDGSLAQCAFELPSGGSAFIFASRDWPSKERSITLHYPGATYLWTLAGLEKVGKGQVAVEGLEPLRRMLGDFMTRCENRQITGVTDGLHGAQVVGCLERLFPSHTSLRLGGRAMGNGMRGGQAVQPVSM